MRLALRTSVWFTLAVCGLLFVASSAHATRARVGSAAPASGKRVAGRSALAPKFGATFTGTNGVIPPPPSGTGEPDGVGGGIVVPPPSGTGDPDIPSLHETIALPPPPPSGEPDAVGGSIVIPPPPGTGEPDAVGGSIVIPPPPGTGEPDAVGGSVVVPPPPSGTGEPDAVGGSIVVPSPAGSHGLPLPPESFAIRSGALGSAALSFRLPAAGLVRVDVFDAAGRRVAGESERFYAAGTHTLSFARAGLASGVYFARATHAGGAANAKLIVVR